MINFRYHVVSLTAVFLALAVGLVLGSTVLNGPMLDALENRVNTLGRDNSQLREQVSFLEEEVDREQEFAAEAAPMLLGGALTGQRVQIVVLPGGEDYVAGVADALTLADGQVTGVLRLTEKFTHPQHRRGELLNLAHRAVPDSVDAQELPANSDGVETSAALLATVLLAPAGADAVSPDEGTAAQGPATGDDGLPGDASVPQDERQAVLSAYVAAEYLSQDEPPDAPADVVVVVAGLPDPDSDAEQRSDAVLTAVSQFAEVGPVVVAASGIAGDGNVVMEVRGDPLLSEQISTVDNASTPQGQTATGLAVAGHMAGQVGHFGIGEGAQRLLPDPTQR